MKYLIALLLLLQTGAAIAQSRGHLADADRPTRGPLVLLDSIETTVHTMFINPDKIESLEVFKDSMATARYGERAKEGAIIIRSKKDAVLMRVQDVAAKYNLAVSGGTRVCINGVEIFKPELVLIEKDELLGATIGTGCRLQSATGTPTGFQYIVITVKSTGK